jgi:rare lipoprotein A
MRISPATAARLALIVLLSVCLAGCGFFSSSKKGEYSGKKGTQKPYTIAGKTYYPLSTADGYSEVGLASWYGPGFHGHRTSNGEIYDMHELTAAHKILPMNTKVEVKNLENGRTVVVRVNDRGPFVSGRIIDMSLAGAKAIGIYGKGTSKVRVSSVGTIPGLTKDGLPGPFYVQIGAFQVQANADKLLARVKRTYGGSRIQFSDIEGQKFWRVQAGTFGTLDEALRRQTDLRGEFSDAFVIAE